MHAQELVDRGLLLLGCGKMGSAMLRGWLDGGLPATSIRVIDPNPSDWLKGTGVQINAALSDAPAIVLIAVKPQVIGDALPAIRSCSRGGSLFVSIAAGVTLATFESVLGTDSPIIRAMPNTPASVGRGVTALIGNSNVTDIQMARAEELLRAVGQTVRLGDERQMDAVTGVSGSGPAYVFHLIESLAAAGEAQGLPPDLAMTLAKATVGGAGALAEASDEDPARLRMNVTSPGGTTQAALEVLMDARTGFPALLDRAVRAAAERSRALSGG